MFLTAHRHAIDKDVVREAIAEAERQTSAEIVVSVSPFFVGSVWKAARRAFARLGVARTRARNGVLIFVVPARRQLVVLCDEGVRERLGDAPWREVATLVAAAFARGEGTTGVVAGVALLGRLLAGPFPREADDVDELPDQPDA